MPAAARLFASVAVALVGGFLTSGSRGAEPRADHWAFVPPTRPAMPRAASDWVRNPIDQFILARLQKQDLAPSPEADRRTLIRRLKFDLLGLPPTPE